MRLLDSTVLIDYLRGRPAVETIAALRKSGQVPATTAIIEEIARDCEAANSTRRGACSTG